MIDSICSKGVFSVLILVLLYLFSIAGIISQTARKRALPDPYYPQKPKGELRLNYYYDRTGRWVKFSDWIPFKQKKKVSRFLEDFYQLYGLPHHYKPENIKESIYFLYVALSSRFRHPRGALCKIKNSSEYHKYRLLMFMKINLLIMRMNLRLGSLYDKRHLYFHDLDVADDLEISFLIARTYYREAKKYWGKAVHYAELANRYPFEIDLPTIESDRFQIVRRELNFARIIDRHIVRVEAKMGITNEFLKQEGKPRPVKLKINQDMKDMYDKDFKFKPLEMPELNSEWKDKPLFPRTE